MKHAWAVFKKEIRRFFTDPRMLMAMILPGILIYALYSLMGNIINLNSIASVDTSYSFKVALSDNYSYSEGSPCLLSLGLDALLEEQGYQKAEYTYYPVEEKEEYIDGLGDNAYDIVVVYDDGFESKVYKSENTLPNMQVYYNSDYRTSEFLYSYVSAAANAIYASYTVNGDASINPNVGSSSSMLMSIMSFIVPMLTISLVFSSCISSCPESIAGEKERGTLSSILITPIKRTEFVLGKFGALIIVSLVSGLISGAGLILSLPNMLSSNSGLVISLSASQVVLLVLSLVSLALLFVAISTMVSTFAKSIKEASAYLGPLMVVFMMFGILPGILSYSPLWMAFIPVMNVSGLVSSSLTGAMDLAYMLITLGMNLVYTALLIYLTALMFKSERIMNRV